MRTLLTMLSILFIISNICSQQNQNAKIHFEPKLEIGIEDTDFEPEKVDTNYIFGRINDVATDINKNIYLVDGPNKCIKKYDSTGTFIFAIGQKGEGPGEFKRITDVFITSSGDLYVCDPGNNRVSIFSSSGKFQKSFQVTSLSMPARIIVDGQNNCYIIGFLIYSGPIIKKYDGHGNLVNEFCQWQKGAKLAAMAGNIGKLAIDDQNRIYYSFSYPYEIRKFSTEGELLQVIKRKVSFFKEPSRAKKTKSHIIGREQTAKSTGLFLLPESKILHIIWGKNEGIFLDFFTADGNFLFSSPFPLIGRIGNIDYEGNIYLIKNDPFPKLIKYKLLIN